MKFGARRAMALRRLESAITRASKSFLPPGRVDRRGADSDDYAQEMRIAAWRSKQDNDHYVQTSVWNRGKDLYRNANRAERFHVEYTRGWEEAYVDNLDVLVDVQMVWVQSPEDDRELLQMRVDGFTFKEIGREVGLSEWEVRQRFKRIAQAYENVLA